VRHRFLDQPGRVLEVLQLASMVSLVGRHIEVTVARKVECDDAFRALPLTAQRPRNAPTLT
jgi:hypothetical protein